MSTAKSIRAITRAVDVIWVLNERPSTPLSLLSDRTGLSRATLLRILNTLQAMGWVYHCRADGSYRLTSTICHLGEQIYTHDRVVEMAAPVLDRLYQQTGLPSDLAVLSEGRMRVLETTRRFHPQIHKGRLLDARLHLLPSELGRAYLAFCPSAERKALLEKLRHSPDCLDRLAHRQQQVGELLAKTRQQGYGEADPGYYRSQLGSVMDLGAVAVPVKTDGRVTACINLIWIEDDQYPVAIHANQLRPLSEAATTLAASLHRCSSL